MTEFTAIWTGMAIVAVVGIVALKWPESAPRKAAEWLPEPGDLFTVSTRGTDVRGMPSAIFRCIAVDTRVIVAREVPVAGVAYPHPQVLARSQYEAHPVGESVARALEIKA